jgi:uncharacterized protein YndB with AHSA1/START domain
MSSDRGQIVPETAVKFLRVFRHPPARVWEFLTSPSRLPEWYGEGNIAPEEGGAVSLMGGHVRGVVTGWRPEKFLAYTWNVFAPGETMSRWPVSYVEMALAPVGERTTLALIHRPIPEPMHRPTQMGWHTMLDLIEAGLAGAFPRRDELFPKNAALYGVDADNLPR